MTTAEVSRAVQDLREHGLVREAGAPGTKMVKQQAPSPDAAATYYFLTEQNWRRHASSRASRRPSGARGRSGQPRLRRPHRPCRLLYASLRHHRPAAADRLVSLPGLLHLCFLSGLSFPAGAASQPRPAGTGGPGPGRLPAGLAGQSCRRDHPPELRAQHRRHQHRQPRGSARSMPPTHGVRGERATGASRARTLPARAAPSEFPAGRCAQDGTAADVPPGRLRARKANAQLAALEAAAAGDDVLLATILASSIATINPDYADRLPEMLRSEQASAGAAVGDRERRRAAT